MTKNLTILLALCQVLLGQPSKDSLSVRGSLNNFGFARQYKSPTVTTWIAISHTVLPIVGGIMVQKTNNTTAHSLGTMIGMYGVIFGPSAGNFYAHDGTRGLIGIGGRLIGISFIVAGSIAYLTSRTDVTSKRGDGRMALLSGTVIYWSSTAYNIFTASSSAREYNEKYKLSIAPIYDPFRHTAGLSFVSSF